MSEVDQGVRCLFLLLDDSGIRNFDETSFMGYTLLPQAFTNDHPEVAEYFSTIRIPVVSKSLVKPFLEKGAGGCCYHLFEGKVKIESPETENEASTSSSLPSVRVSVYEKVPNLEIYVYFRIGTHFNFSNSKDLRYTEPMSQAILEVMEEFLKEECWIKYWHNFHGLIIDFAVKRRQVDLVKLLLEYTPFAPTRWEEDAGRVLCIAVCKGLHEIADLLIEYGVRLENAFAYVCDDYRYSDFGFGGGIKACERLLQFGEENYLMCFISNYLRMVIKSEHHDVFDLICSHCPDVTCKDNQTTFHITFIHHKRDSSYRYYYEKMKDYGFKVKYDKIDDIGLLLLGAIMNNWFEVVKKLIEAGADVTQEYKMSDNLCNLKRAPETFNFLHADKNYTPLYVAILCAGEAVINLLVEHGADATAEINHRKLICAIQSRNVDGVKFLIKHGASVQHDPDLICQAIRCNHSEIVKLLLLNRAPSSLEDTELARLVSLAMTEVADAEVMKVLSEFGTQLNVDFTFKFDKKRAERYPDILQTLLEHNFTAVDCDCVKKIIKCMAAESGKYSKFLYEDAHKYYALARKVLQHQLIRYYTAFHGCMIENKILYLNPTPKAPRMLFTDFAVSCTAEVRRMKCETVGDSDITFYDILTKDVHQLARYAKHYDFVETMGKEDYRNDFPCYASILNCQFEKGARRRYLLDRGCEICSFLSLGLKKLRDADVMEYIIKYLSNYNLEVLNYEFERYLASTDRT